MAAPMRSVLWEVIAPVVRWPLWSPVRFIGVIAVVLLLVILAARLGSDTSPASITDGDGSSVEQPAPQPEDDPP